MIPFWVTLVVALLVGAGMFFVTLRLDEPQWSALVSVYEKGLRTALFSGFLTLGGFMLALKTFIVVKMKEMVYDHAGYLEDLKEWRQLNPRLSHYGPLRALSDLLFTAILCCFTTSILQFTAGLSLSRFPIAACLASAGLAMTFMLTSLLMTWLNLRKMFEYVENESRKKHSPDSVVGRKL